MKKIFFISAALVALLCSCQKENAFSPRNDIQAQSEGRAILFGVKSAGLNLTRALSENKIAALDGGFSIMSVNASNATYFDTLAVKKGADPDDANAVLFGVDNFYWPVSGALSFYGVYPKTGYKFSNTSGSVSFPVGSQASQFAANVDILAARNISEENGTPKIPLEFGHVLHWLSDITFVAADANATVTLKKVSLDAPGYGTFTFASDSLGKWGSLPAAASYKNYELYKGTLAISKEGTALGSNMTDVMVIAAGECTLNVDYSVTVNGASSDYSKSAKINLWQGKKSTVKASLTNDMTAIVFSVTVKDWTPEEIIAELS